MEAPDGHFADGMIVFTGLEKGGYISKGYAITVPDLENADAAHHNALQDVLVQILGGVPEAGRLQVQWRVDSDYSRELTAYKAVTDERCAPESWARRARDERYVRYWRAMENRQLRREALHVYLTLPVVTDNVPRKSKGLVYRHLLDSYAEQFLLFGQYLAGTMASVGGDARPLDNVGHFSEYHKFLNPGSAWDTGLDLGESFVWDESIQEGSWHSDLNVPERADHGFYLDGNYHGMLVLKRYPGRTYPSIVNSLTKQGFLDYSITVNIKAADIDAEVDKEQKKFNKNQGDYNDGGTIKSLTAMNVAAAKIARLSRGDIIPYHTQYIIRVWDATQDGLRGKLTALKSAVTGMGRAQAYEPNLLASVRDFFFSTWPGWSFGTYSDLYLYADDRNVCDLLPFTATPSGHLEGAEALYDGSSRNLVGFRSFMGAGRDEMPQHATMLGISGAGKSVNAVDILTQTDPYYDYTVIIEEGLSYGTFTRTYGAEPIIINPNGNFTINYLDTAGSPVNGIHTASATALIRMMVGESASSDVNEFRGALISEAVRRLYTDYFEDWSRANPATLAGVEREALAIERYRRAHLGVTGNQDEAYQLFKEWQERHPDEAAESLADLDDGEVIAFSRESGGERLVQNLAFARMRPDEMPTHSILQEVMRAEASGAHKAELHHIATMMAQWNAGGDYGPLFDGISNVDLSGRIAHFELGEIPAASDRLKAAVAFLITNYTRNHIMSMSRALRKRNLWEEISRFVHVPGGAQLINESYSLLRKYGVWNLAVVQVYGQFKNTPIKSPVLGNSRILLAMRQQDMDDVNDISESQPIPQVTKDAIMSFPSPEHQRGVKFSSMMYRHSGDRRPTIATIRNVASKEMIYVSSTSGAVYEARCKALRQYPDILEGIKHEAAKL